MQLDMTLTSIITFFLYNLCLFNINYKLYCQVVANCLSALQEIWSLEASHSEEACREKESLLSKPVIYYFLNRYVLKHASFNCLSVYLVVVVVS